MITSVEDFAATFNVSRETIERLQIYEDLLKRWNPKINLVANSTLDTTWSRHFADSAQILGLAPEGQLNWLDIGSGAGFPGLVIAALSQGETRQISMTLVESDQRKSVFMRTAAREMGLSVSVKTERIENLPDQNADIISARALAALSKLLSFSEQHRKKSGVCLFPKGERADFELTEAAQCWNISYEKFPSMTDSDAMIIRIGEFQRAKK